MKKYELTKDEKKAIPFILPGVMVTALLIVYPLLYIITMSFSSHAMGGGGFSGLTNYIRLFHNPMFLKAVGNTVQWTFFTVLVSFILGTAYALLIQYKAIRCKGFFRSAIFIAWIIPGVVKATSWKWLLATDGGMANHLLMTLGVIHSPVPWLTSPRFALIAIMIVQIWSCAPYCMLMMTAGISQLPRDLYESAELDGAGRLKKLIYITMPLLKDISFICILMLLVWAINEFSLIWIMTNGSQNTTTLSLLIYNQFKVLNLNAASASAVMQLLVTMLFAMLYIRFLVKEEMP